VKAGGHVEHLSVTTKGKLPVFESVDRGRQRMHGGFVAEIKSDEDRRNDTAQSLHEHHVILVDAALDHRLRGQSFHPTTHLHVKNSTQHDHCFM